MQLLGHSNCLSGCEAKLFTGFIQMLTFENEIASMRVRKGEDEYQAIPDSFHPYNKA